MAVVRQGKHWAVVLYKGKGEKREWYGPRQQRRDHGHPFSRAEAVAFDELHGDAGRPESESVRSFAERWVADFPRRKDSTNDTNRYIARVVARHFGERPLRSVSRKDARAFALERRYARSGTRAMFNDALDEGLIEHNPFNNLRLPQSKGRRNIEVLTREEVSALGRSARSTFSESPPIALRVEAMVLTLAYTGLRPGELMALEWGDVDFDAERIHVRRRIDSKGRIDLPKNGETRRAYLFPEIAEAIRTLPRSLAGAYVFTNTAGEPFRPNSFGYYFNQLRRSFESELDPVRRDTLARARGGGPLTLYELRHFAAAYALNTLGLAPHEVATHLGHSDKGDLVIERYGHLDEEAVIARLERSHARAVGE